MLHGSLWCAGRITAVFRRCQCSATHSRILRARKGAGRQHRHMKLLDTSLMQCQQMARNISAVDGRNIARQAGRKGARVVPVQEMAVEALEPVQCGDGRGQAIGHCPQAEPAEVPRRQRGEQVQAEIGGGTAMRENGDDFLIVVRAAGSCRRP